MPPTLVESEKVISSPEVIGLPFLSVNLKATSETLGRVLLELPLSAIESGVALVNSSSPTSGAATVMLAIAIAPFGNLAVIVSSPAQPAS